MGKGGPGFAKALLPDAATAFPNDKPQAPRQTLRALSNVWVDCQFPVVKTAERARTHADVITGQQAEQGQFIATISATSRRIVAMFQVREAGWISPNTHQAFARGREKFAFRLGQC